MKATIMFGVFLAVVRVWIGFTVEPEPFAMTQAYKDTAHLFMGGLAVAAWRDRQAWQHVLFWGLCVLEVAVAVFSRI